MPSVFLRPGVFVRETDLSQIIPAVATSTAAIVAYTNKGPANKIVTVTNPDKFVELFGRPNPVLGWGHYAALAYLQEGSQLKFTRVINGATFSGRVISDDVSLTNQHWAELVANQNASATLSTFIKFLSKIPIVPASLTVDMRIPVTAASALAVALGSSGANVRATATATALGVITGPASCFTGTLDESTGEIRITMNGELFTAFNGGNLVAASVGPYNFVLPNTPVLPGSVSTNAGGEETFTDNGDGTLTGDNGGTGTVNYTTGAVSITLGVAAAGTGAILTDYRKVLAPVASTAVMVEYDFIPVSEPSTKQSIFLGQGTGAPVSFSETLKTPVQPTTDAANPKLRIYKNGVLVARDNGTGGIVEIPPSAVIDDGSSSVNYTTGVLTLAFTTPPSLSDYFTVEYETSAVTDTEAFDFTDYSDPLLGVFGANEGAWTSGTVKVRLVNFDDVNKTFDVQVYFLEGPNFVPKETFTVSRQKKVGTDGAQLYLEDRINDRSAYIRVQDNNSVSDTVMPSHTVSGEVVATGNGTVNLFTADLNRKLVQPGTFTLSATVGVATETLRDDFAGNLINAGGSKVGTINYETGEIENAAFSAAPNNATNITASYFAGIEAVLGDGIDGNAVTSTQIINGWDLYANPDKVDIRVLVNSGYSVPSVQNKMIAICEDRMDCVAVLDVPSAEQEPDDAVRYRRETLNANTSYAALYSSDIKIQDTFNDQVLNVPPSGYIAGIFAKNDNLGNPATAPAGFRRGKLLNVLGVARNYDPGEQELLYSNGVNYVRVFEGEGVVVWGQKTLLTAASALNRLNVRREFIVLEKSVSIFSLNTVFENNNDFTRSQLSEPINDYLELKKANGEIFDFRVVCDDTNNTSGVIEQNELKCAVGVKPEITAEFIDLNFIVTRRGASFEELIAQGAFQ